MKSTWYARRRHPAATHRTGEPDARPSTARPLTDLVPPQAHVALVGRDAVRTATPEAAVSLGVRVDPYARDCPAIGRPFAVSVVGLLATIVLACTLLPGAINQAQDHARVHDAAVAKVQKAQEAQEAKAQRERREHGLVTPVLRREAQHVTKNLLGLASALMLGFGILALASGNFQAMAVMVAGAVIMLATPWLIATLTAAMDSSGHSPTPRPPGAEYLTIAVTGLVTVAANVALAGWAVRATQQRLRAFRDARLAAVHPYARGAVTATPGDDSVTVSVTLLIPEASGQRTFWFRPTVVETTEWPHYASDHALEHASQRRAEVEELTNDAHTQWLHAAAGVKGEAEGAAEVAARAAVPAAEAKTIANLINRGA